jgi:transcriptional regulator with XRE-family HTH domain
MPLCKSTFADVDELDAVMAGRLRAVLDDRGMRREDMAGEMTQLGFRWTGNTVTQVITGRRGLSLLELAGICSVLGTSLTDLLGSNSEVKLPNFDARLPVADIAEAIRSGGGNWGRRGLVRTLFGPVQREFEEVRTKAARRLGVAPEQVDEAAIHLWGRPLGAERDHRFDTSDFDFNAPENRRTLQARRGHATRALIDELRAYFAEQQGLQR